MTLEQYLEKEGWLLNSVALYVKGEKYENGYVTYVMTMDEMEKEYKKYCKKYCADPKEKE